MAIARADDVPPRANPPDGEEACDGGRVEAGDGVASEAWTATTGGDDPPPRAPRVVEGRMANGQVACYGAPSKINHRVTNFRVGARRTSQQQRGGPMTISQLDYLRLPMCIRRHLSIIGADSILPPMDSSAAIMQDPT